MIIICDTCDVQSRCKSTKEWYYHLISPEHQQGAKSAFETSTPWSHQQRMVTCYNFGPSMNDELKLIEHFGRLGFIHDIYFNRHCAPPHAIKNCVVLMDSKEATLNLLQHHNVDGVGMVVLKCRSDVTDTQWEKAIGSNKTDLFEARHQYLINLCANLPPEEQFLEFIKEISLNPDEQLKRYDFLCDLKSALKSAFPEGLSLKPFGSYATNLGDNSADVDVFVDVCSSEDDEPNWEEVEEVFEQALNALNKYNRKQGAARERIFKSIHPIRATRVPIIKIQHGPTKVHADLSFNSRISQHNTKLLKFFINYDPRVKPFLKFLRYWGEFHQIMGSNAIKTYALMLMGIVVLNQEKVVPSIHFLQGFKGLVEEKRIEGWNVAFMDSVETVREEISLSDISTRVPNEEEITHETILKLLAKFFQFYGNLDFDETVVCPLLGTVGAKKIFEKEVRIKANNLPFTFEQVMQLRLTDMVVQDPIVLDYNVTAAVHRKLVSKFQHLCQVTEANLEAILAQSQSQNQSSSTSSSSSSIHNSGIYNIIADGFISVPVPTTGKTKTKSEKKTKTKSNLDLNKNPSSEHKQIEDKLSDKRIIAIASKSATKNGTEIVDLTEDEPKPMDVPIAIAEDEADDIVMITTSTANNHDTNTTTITTGLPAFEAPATATASNSLSQSVSMELLISDQFKSLFMNTFENVGVEMSMSTEHIENKMRVLWTSYIWNFWGEHIWEKYGNLVSTRSKKEPFQVHPSFNIAEAKRLNEVCNLPYTIGKKLVTVPGTGSDGVPLKQEQLVIEKLKITTTSTTDEQRKSTKRKNESHSHSYSSMMSKVLKCVDEIENDNNGSQGSSQDETDNVNFKADLECQRQPELVKENEPLPVMTLIEKPINVMDRPTALVSMLAKIHDTSPKPYYVVLKLTGDARPFIGREKFGTKEFLQYANDPLIANVFTTSSMACNTLKIKNETFGNNTVKFFCELSVTNNAGYVRLHETIPESDAGNQLAVVDLVASDLLVMFHHFCVAQLFKQLKC